ncbi:MAG: alpha/beta hydrolase [Deltaproteobacteria bacterium]|nr:alpha/beta hydrolase [Deltaproteobacteria bacterium]
MATTQVYYATNRRHHGADRWHPTGYGQESSKDGTENLRFGRVTIRYDQARAARWLEEGCGFGAGNGEKPAKYFLARRSDATIEAFPEDIRKDENETTRPQAKLGSARPFSELHRRMDGDHVLIFVHGFNVSWWEAVASVASLQSMLNRHCTADRASYESAPVHVVLFTWPSDGLAIPYWSYLKRALEFSVGGRLPRIFEQIFLCAADLASDVFQPAEPFHHLPQMARAVTIYHNRSDLAMPVSDYTKGNTDRLGWDGAEWPAYLPNRVHQVDCSRLVSGLVEHSYYHCGAVNDDIRQSIDGIPNDSRNRSREPVRHGWQNVWRLVDE